MDYVDYLMMYKKVEPTEFVNEFNGFTFRKFDGSESDIKLWFEICRCGIIRDDETLESAYKTRLIEHIGYNPDTIYFVMENGVEITHKYNWVDLHEVEENNVRPNWLAKMILDNKENYYYLSDQTK